MGHYFAEAVPEVLCSLASHILPGLFFHTGSDLACLRAQVLYMGARKGVEREFSHLVCFDLSFLEELIQGYMF